MNSYANQQIRAMYIDGVSGSVTLKRPVRKTSSTVFMSPTMDIIPPERLSLARSTQLANRQKLVSKKQPAPVRRKQSNLFEASGALATSISALFAGVKWAPKRYTAVHGQQNDYSGKTFSRAKLATPVAIVLLLLSLATAAWPLVENYSASRTPHPAAKAVGSSVIKSSASKINSGNTAQSAANTTTSSSTVSTDSTISSAANAAGVSTGGNSAAVPPANGPAASPAGGMGGGTSNPPITGGVPIVLPIIPVVPIVTPILDSVTGGLLPLTVTVPAVDLQVGSHLLIDTPPLSISL